MTRYLVVNETPVVQTATLTSMSLGVHMVQDVCVVLPQRELLQSRSYEAPIVTMYLICTLPITHLAEYVANAQETTCLMNVSERPHELKFTPAVDAKT